MKFRSTMPYMIPLAMLALAITANLPAVWGRGGTDLVRKATWSQPTSAEAKARMEEWLTAIQADDATKAKATSAWESMTSTESDELVLERTVTAIAAVEPQANEVLTTCRAESVEVPKRFAFLFEDKTNEFVRANLRVLYGRYLAQHSHFDEALEHFSGLTPQQVVDPATLLFYQCVAQHRLLQKDECLATLTKLMENESQLPRRYRTLAQLMEADIKPLKPDSLDEIARLMDDIQRRLKLAQAGKKVRKEEDDVVAKLDKMIEDLEQQQKKQQAAGAGAGGTQSSNPAQDSHALQGRGPGDVDQKKLGSKSGWGNLPPKDRERALQQISKDLPAHFREVIEEYFRKLAREGSED